MVTGNDLVGRNKNTIGHLEKKVIKKEHLIFTFFMQINFI